MTSSYQFSVLTVPDATYTSPEGFNDQGTIVGFYYKATGGYGGFSGTANALEPLAGLPDASTPSAINNNGVIVGVDQGGPTQTTFIDNNGAITTFSAPGYYYTYPAAINNSNEVVGFYTNGDANGLQFYSYENGILATLGGIVGQYGVGSNVLINSTGEIAGWYIDMSGAYQTFTDMNGVVAPLNIGLSGASVTGLNDAGVIVGNYDRGNYAFIDYHGVITTLNVVGSVFTQVVSINDSGMVLGYAASFAPNGNQFFLYNINTATYTFIPLPSGLTSSAFPIAFNNAGDVIGFDGDHGWQYFVAAPTDPGPTATNPSKTIRLGQTLDLAGTVLATPGQAGDTLTVSADSASTGSANLSGGGDLLYTPGAHLAANATASDVVSYTVIDQYGNQTSGTLAVTVTNLATNISGGPYGSSTIQGTSGADIITAYGYNNTIYDNGGNDVVYAGAGNATVNSGTGDVVVNFGGYNDIVKGGDGWVTVAGSQGNASVTLGNGNDSVVVAGYNNVVQAGDGADAVSGIQGNSVVRLGNGGDSVAAAGYSNQITTGSGNDTIVAGDGNATVSTGGGDDLISLAGWSNWIDAGVGNNTVSIKNGGNDTFVLHAGGTDEVFGYTAAGGDLFDLRSVLAGASLSIGSDFAKLGTYLHVTNTGGNVALQFSATGSWAGAGAATLAVLHAVGAGVGSLSDLVTHNAIRIM